MLQRASARNLILASFSRFDRAAIGAFLQPVELKERMILQHPNKPVECAYFVESGVISQRIAAAGSILETAVVGFRGAIGTSVLFGGHVATYQSVVLFPGSAWRIRADELRRVAGEHCGIHESLSRCDHVLTMQSALTGLCCVRHSLEQRLACWLCLASDASGSNVLPITHDYLSFILGLRRPGVTEVLARFESDRLIDKMRGILKIKERELLERRACRCCGVVTKAYASLAGSNTIDCPGEASVMLECQASRTGMMIEPES